MRKEIIGHSVSISSSCEGSAIKRKLIPSPRPIVPVIISTLLVGLERRGVWGRGLKPSG